MSSTELTESSWNSIEEVLSEHGNRRVSLRLYRRPQKVDLQLPLVLGWRRCVPALTNGQVLKPSSTSCVAIHWCFRCSQEARFSVR